MAFDDDPGPFIGLLAKRFTIHYHLPMMPVPAPSTEFSMLASGVLFLPHPL